MKSIKLYVGIGLMDNPELDTINFSILPSEMDGIDIVRNLQDFSEGYYIDLEKTQVALEPIEHFTKEFDVILEVEMNFVKSLPKNIGFLTQGLFIDDGFTLALHKNPAKPSQFKKNFVDWKNTFITQTSVLQ
ncbi:hypothetical protein bcgnr5390_13590 [Bacillus luti]|nr:hypothetical protein BC2903_54990 [Bacillus cereus]